MTRVGTIGPLIPPMIWIIDIPTRAEDIAKRHHNRLAKAAIRDVMERFHREKVPDRFKQNARQRFKHFDRSPKYKKFKLRRHGSTRDLVKTGRTERWMTRAYKLTISGNATSGNLKANLSMRFPFKGGSGRSKKRTRQSDKMQKMIREIQRFADDEPALFATWLKEAYMKRVESFRSTRKRTRIS